ncbi:MAG: 3D domain-containing protein [Christensenellales bacterium]
MKHFVTKIANVWVPGRHSKVRSLEKNFIRKIMIAASGMLVVSILASVIVTGQIKSVTLTDGSNVIQIKTFGRDVETFLQDNAIELGQYDRLSVPLEAPLQDGLNIVVSRAKTLRLTDGAADAVVFHSAAEAVADLLAEKDIVLGEQDAINYDLQDAVYPGMHIVIDRIVWEETESTQPIPFETKTENSSALAKGVEKIEVEGISGEKRIVTRVVYKNGEEIERYPVAEQVVTQPQDQKVLIGTRVRVAAAAPAPTPTPAAKKSTAASVQEKKADTSDKSEDKAKAESDAKLIQGKPYSKVITCSATAYTATGNRTATGTVPSVGTVAVDPSVIPMGTRLYIQGYGFGVAADKGGAIKGNKVDVFFNSRTQCLNWGRRSVKVYILE